MRKLFWKIELTIFNEREGRKKIARNFSLQNFFLEAKNPLPKTE